MERQVKPLRLPDMFQAVEEAHKNLPLGHVDIRKAEEAIKKEYAVCKEQEKSFCKRMGKRWTNYSLSYQEAADFSAELSRSLGTKPIKMVLPKPMETSFRINAYYDPQMRTIFAGYYSSTYCGLRHITILHETAHHVQFSERMFRGGMHGADFCMIENLMFDYLSN